MIEAIRIIEKIVGQEADIKFEESKKGDVRDTYAYISKARDVLNYRPGVTLEEGLKKEIEWFEENREILRPKLR